MFPATSLTGRNRTRVFCITRQAEFHAYSDARLRHERSPRQSQRKPPCDAADQCLSRRDQHSPPITMQTDGCSVCGREIQTVSDLFFAGRQKRFQYLESNVLQMPTHLCNRLPQYATAQGDRKRIHFRERKRVLIITLILFIFALCGRNTQIYQRLRCHLFKEGIVVSRQVGQPQQGIVGMRIIKGAELREKFKADAVAAISGFDVGARPDGVGGRVRRNSVPPERESHRRAGGPEAGQQAQTLKALPGRRRAEC